MEIKKHSTHNVDPKANLIQCNIETTWWPIMQDQNYIPTNISCYRAKQHDFLVRTPPPPVRRHHGTTKSQRRVGTRKRQKKNPKPAIVR